MIGGQGGAVAYFEYTRSGSAIFTLSEDGIFKQLEVATNKCLISMNILDWEAVQNESLKYAFSISLYEDFFLIHGYMQKENETSFSVIQEYCIADSSRIVYTNDEFFPRINSAEYSLDSEYITVVYDSDSLGQWIYLYKQGKEKHLASFNINCRGVLITAYFIDEKTL